METYFASSERSSDAALHKEIALASGNPLIDGLLRAAYGLLAILNERRQIVAVNRAFLDMLGVKDAAQTLGLRPGEAIACVHAHEMPGGCGTSKFCSTCGAAVAIVATLATHEPAERDCVATVERNGKTFDLCLRVRSSLIPFARRRFILLYLQDITLLRRWAALERAFLHDLSNLVEALQGTTAALGAAADEPGRREAVAALQQISSRLTKEVVIQRALLRDQLSECPVTFQEVSAAQVLQEFRALFANHPAARGKSLRLPETAPPLRFHTDLSLLLRVLANMLINALEATEDGGEVKLWLEWDTNSITFRVWSRRAIPEDIARRVFQRHFTTKPEPGRGLGTHAMKMLGEELLGGAVRFTTSDQDGTVFRLTLPL